MLGFLAEVEQRPGPEMKLRFYEVLYTNRRGFLVGNGEWRRRRLGNETSFYAKFSPVLIES